MTNPPLLWPRSEEADIALLLEGTYPFVSGGVSSWVNGVLHAYPDYRFALIFIGSRPQDYGEAKYQLPPNVVHLEMHYLYEPAEKPPVASRPGNAHIYTRAKTMLRSVENSDSGMADILRGIQELSLEMVPGGRLTQEDFLYSEKAWKLLRNYYRRYCADPSFVDFFWTVRTMFQPLWKLAAIAQNLPKVRVLHSISTGYAGFTAALGHHLHGVPFILSEHGIYTKERKIDLLKAEWIRDNRNVFQRDTTEVAYFRRMWVRFFEWLGRYAYASANPIIALYDANRLRQISDGALAERTLSIPNGIALERFAPLATQRPDATPPVLCLIGRVVPIKDVKTFIRAMRRVINQLPEAQGWIAGPMEESPEYAKECQALTRSLGLEEQVKFLGMQQVDQLLPRCGAVVLSSISEALPLVVLEAFAAGVPVVSTDVGCCRELINGVTPEDRALGSAGAIVSIADPQALADACVELVSNSQQWKSASEAAQARVNRFYSSEQMYARYRAVYEQALRATEESA